MLIRKVVLFSSIMFFFVALNVNAATISWTASKTLGVTYNLYVNGKLNKSRITGTNYTDERIDRTEKFSMTASKNGIESDFAFAPLVGPYPPTNIFVEIEIDVKVDVKIKDKNE